MSWLLLEGGLALFLLIAVVDSNPISNQIKDRLVYPDSTPNGSGHLSNTDDKILMETYQGFCSGVTNGTKLAANLDYDGVTCHEVGTQGPCPSNMKFYSVPGKSDLGMCDCDQEMKGIAYNSVTEQCNQLFCQESCAEGEWLQLTSTGLVCLPNPCNENSTNTSEMSTTNESCVTKVLLDGFCVTLNDNCTRSDGIMGQVGFDASNKISCLPLEANYSLSKSTPHLKCSVGTRWSEMTNTCRKAIKFTFN